MTMNTLARILREKTVLVTGGGGTIGSEIARQVAGRKPARIVCLGRREGKLIAVRDELLQAAPDVDVITEVCNVCERDRLDAVFSAHRPNIVFHTAAKKDVHDAEAYPAEAVMVNVQGTVNVVDMALANNSDMMVFTSSTKAFHPVSVMGATKRLGEMIVSLAAARTGKFFFTVRFSNVLESNGGVYGLFRRQIESGGPVTVTHPDAERTFVTASEIARLLLEALLLGQKGKILLLVAGEKTKIESLARSLISSYGLQAGREIDIAYIGLRRGERLVEETAVDGTDWLSTTHDDILVSSFEGASPPGVWFDNSMRELLLLANSGEASAVLKPLRKLVPSL